MMDSDIVKAFNAELVSLYELRPPISKKKIVDITKAAMKAIKYYKHVVFGVEKFLTKCKPEYKIPGLYCIDSIIRQSRHQFKDKDVFAPRFAVNMQTTLANLLSCKSEDKPKVVRVLNLWKSHDIFDEAHVQPWLEYCRVQHGLETDLSRVEKAVKGELADMSIYTRTHAKGEKRKPADPQTPPPLANDDLRGRTPPLPAHEPSDEAVEGGVSERETLAMLTAMGLDLGGMFSSDPSLLQKVHKIVNDKLVERREIDTRRQGNIKNLLSREFDYSDEEDSGDEDSRRLQMDIRPTELTKQQIMGMAEAVLREPDTKEEIQRLHTERLSALTQAAAARVQAAQTAASVAPVRPSPVPPPVQIPLNPVVSSASSAAVPTSSVPKSVQAPAHLLLSPRAQQVISGVPPPGVHAFAPNMPPPNFNLPPPQAHLLSQSRDRVEVDQDDRMERSEDKYDRDDRERRERDRDRDRRDERRRDRSRERDRGDRMYGDSRGSKRSRRSRSRERGSGRERRRSGSDERSHRVPSRNHNSAYKEMERSRRKMGLPWPPKEGHVLIASCTLWFGRIPPNCSEDDIRLSVMEAGEPARITIIHSRACAYVTMKDRKSAFRVMDRLQRNIQVAKKNVKLNWGTGQGLKSEKYMDYWDSSRGISLIPYNKLPDDLEPLLEGGHLDVETLPPNLAGLYDEHGLKGKKAAESAPAQAATSDVTLPVSLPPFPFPMNQPPPMGASFFPPGMVPLAGAFPPALPPAIRVPPPAAAPATRPQTQNDASTATSSSTTAPNAALAQQQMIALAGMANSARMRMPNFDANGLPGAASFTPPSFSSPPPNRFPGSFRGAPGAFVGPGCSPGAQRAGFDVRFQGRPSFPPVGQFPVMGPPPARFFPPSMAPPFGIPPPNMRMPQDKTDGNHLSTDEPMECFDHEEKKRNPQTAVSSNLTAIIPVETEAKKGAANAEPVTSTTGDDDINSEEQPTMVEVNGAEQEEDDFKVTRENDG